MGLLIWGTLAMSCGARDDAQRADAGIASNADPRAVRRKLRLHDERPAVLATPARGPLPFAVESSTEAFGPTPVSSKQAIETPPAPQTGASTFFVPSPIAPMPDRSGRYVLRRRDWATFFTPSGLAFALSARARETDDRDARWGLHCALVGARDGTLVPEQEQHGRVHDYVGAPSKWATEAPTYGRLAWEDVYPGVDMVAEPTRGGIAYRFVLSPGARVEDVVMRWEGATSLRVVDDGRGIDVATDLGVLRVRGLRAFAIAGEQRTDLVARHVVRGDRVTIEVDGWDGRAPLVIDPTIGWSSYLGGAGGDYGSAIAVDGGGNVLVAGRTMSIDFPNGGGFDTILGGS